MTLAMVAASGMSAAVSHPQEQKPTLAVGEVLLDEVDRTEFQVQELIGRGGMGEVYRAMRRSDGACCAVKCVRSDLLQNPTIRLRTRFESIAFRKISHRNVVRVQGTGVRGDNVPWMAMEWLSGFTLAEIIEKMGKIPVRWAVEIVRDLCLGLQAIHPYAIHRDIKPSNAHFGFDAVTRALDLGAAKSKEANVHLTTTGFQVGTLPYMAPEQLDNSVPIDHRTDLWGAIIVLYMLMTGVHPFAVRGMLPGNRYKLGCRILQEPHVPLLDVLPSAPPGFAEIIDRGLAKDPDRRHRSAEELAQVLNAALEYLEGKAGHAEPLSSLVDVLRGDAKPVGDGGFAHAEPAPRRLWVPPRTIDPMPPKGLQAAPEQGALEQRALDPALDAATTEERPGWLGRARERVRGEPRWFLALMSTSALVLTCQAAYYFGVLRSTEPASRPIAVPIPVLSSPAPEAKREPAPAPTVKASVTASAATAAPSSPSRPDTVSRSRRPTPPTAPTSSASRRRPILSKELF
jgi:serine/threonine protein kinase